MILQKFCETTRHTMTGSVLIYHVFSLTLKIGHLASTNKMFLKVSKDTSRNTNFQCRVNDIFKLLSARRHFITNQTMKVNCQFPPIYTLYCMPISYYLRIWPPLPSRFDMKPISINIVLPRINNTMDDSDVMLMTINQNKHSSTPKKSSFNALSVW